MYVILNVFSPGVINDGLVDELHLDLVEDVLEVVLAGGQLQIVVAVVGALEHDDVAVHQLVQYLAACTRLNPTSTYTFTPTVNNQHNTFKQFSKMVQVLNLIAFLFTFIASELK